LRLGTTCNQPQAINAVRVVPFRHCGMNAPAQAGDQWESQLKLIILFVVVIGAILFWWLRSVKPKRRI
jgi:hypothetical protein